MSIVFIKYCWANRMSIKKQISQTQETELNRSSGYSFREDLCPPETMSAQVGSVSYPQHRAPVRHSIYTSFTQAGSAQEDCFVSSTNVSCEWKPSQGTKGHRGSPRVTKACASPRWQLYIYFNYSWAHNSAASQWWNVRMEKCDKPQIVDLSHTEKHPSGVSNQNLWETNERICGTWHIWHMIQAAKIPWSQIPERLVHPLAASHSCLEIRPSPLVSRALKASTDPMDLPTSCSPLKDDADPCRGLSQTAAASRFIRGLGGYVQPKARYQNGP